MSLGKVPPHNKEAESSILGVLLMERGAYDRISDIINADCFYYENHKIIFESIQELSIKGHPTDIVSIVTYLKSKDMLEVVGGMFAITSLTNSVVSSASLENWALVVKQEFLKRELIRVSGSIYVKSFENNSDVFELLEETEREVYQLSLSTSHKDVQSADKVLMKTIERIEFLRNNPQEFTGITSGINSIDKITKGWQPSDLIILAARPSVGKTAFALTLLANACESIDLLTGKPTCGVIFSLEMGSTQLMDRMLSAKSEIPLELIKTGRVANDQMKVIYDKGVKRIANTNLFIDDTASITVGKIRSICRRLKIKHNLGIVVIDYLQLMNGSAKAGNREQEISQISRELKILAKDLNVPVIALSQLSREVEKRSSKEPQLSDLRESGAIEQDADIVMFLYRPSKEEILQDIRLKDTGILKIAKHRNGELGEVPLLFKGWIQKWEDIPQDNYQPFISGFENNENLF